MTGGENKIMRRRLANAYLSAVISISLVLLLVGVASMLLVNAKSVSDYFKEHMQISVLLKQEVEDDEALAFQAELDSLEFIHSTRFVSREEGTEEMKEMLGEDFLSVFETSPVPSSLELTLEAQYVEADSLDKVKARLLESPLVDEVDYQQSLVESLNENIGKISLLLGVFIVLLLFISFVLINNTVRLNVFARRFTIHTMKMVGATRSFIRSPFMVQAVFQGLFAAFLAILLLLLALFFVRRSFAQLFSIFQLKLLLLVIGIVIVSGVVICVVSTYFVVNKLVSLKRGELYY
ncbi:MAG: permease-like cell division protein FtsX [Bacteroidales bacterium]|jgi:cell division transport system permease protein|nr:permease-like cell division protein FtsX [Bacteroidales bacterium]MBQ1906364.1 permease-like cell division protein FtsX [Bacteroidales bacterium]MBQ2502563.1 permease-like cell division protein FtsX [Bacteroidales bacterium]MBQ3977016.1 permease-like cell division protein FtsX [Bacteroidales bacterium]MBQ4168703.1 permease-like cell division protein FtsX [Bacteroidales bacterium]